MAFDVKIIFSGLVMFVPNSYEKSKARMCALLLDGTNLKVRDEDGAVRERYALDGKSKLRYHKAFIRFPIDIVSGIDPAIKSENLGIWHLDRQRLILKTTPPEKEGLNKFETQGLEHDVQGSRTNENADNFFWTANLNRVYEDFKVNPTLLFPNPPSGTIAAQFFIDQGKLGCESPTGFIMEYDSTLSDKIYKSVFSHEVSLVLQNLESATLTAISFDGSRPRRELDLARLPKIPGIERETVEIYILNLCIENSLQWYTEHAPSPDEDSKWYYELLSDHDKKIVKDHLWNGFLPIPRPVRESREPGGPGSTNCIPKRTTNAVDFSVHDLDSPDYEES